MKAKEPVAEEQYEIGVDIHGIRDGPRLGRLRRLNEVISCNYHLIIFQSHLTKNNSFV